MVLRYGMSTTVYAFELQTLRVQPNDAARRQGHFRFRVVPPTSLKAMTTYLSVSVRQTTTLVVLGLGRAFLCPVCLS